LLHPYSFTTRRSSDLSKSLPLICESVARFESLQLGSGAPEMNQFEPLSATNMPYFLSAVRITRTSAGNDAMLTLALRRTRRPMRSEEHTSELQSQSNL